MASFKQYQRTMRTQQPEENYGLGMYYTDAPLKQGYCKELINFNFRNNGDTLVPRLGLCATELALFKTFSDTTPVYNTGVNLIAGKVIRTSDNIVLDKILTSDMTGATLQSSGLYTGKCYLNTIEAHDGTSVITDIPVRKMSNELISANGAFFKKPNKAEIHGMSLVQTDAIFQNVGCFAFNNEYYYFRKNTKLVNNVQTDITELAYTDYTENTQATVITPRALTPKEAIMWGYNMLSKTPYTFSNATSSANIQLLGALPYVGTDLVMSPQVNQTITLKCFYDVVATAVYTFKWEWKDPGSSDWVLLKTEDVTSPNTAECTFSSPVTTVLVRITATLKTNNTIMQVLTMGINFTKDEQPVIQETYDLSQASGMTYWRKHLVVYGVPKDRTILFVSDVNDPTFFPYPNNVDTFEEPIVHVIPLLDNLLVFTATQLYLLSWTPDGLGWNKRLIQSNLSINDWDLHLIQQVKNMVFFKSGNYYYMVVPKAQSITGDLTVAPICKPTMEMFFDNFSANIDNILEKLYYYKEDKKLIHYYNFLDYEDVHNMYVFETTSGKYINFDLLYNVASRNWRIHTYESEHILHSYRQAATQPGILMSVIPIVQTISGVTKTITGIQFLKNINFIQVKDFYIPKNTVYPTAEGYDVYTTFDNTHKFRNHQLLDTGYRELYTDLKKRYREFQFKINNVSKKTLAFFTEFYTDGEERRGSFKYTTVHENGQLYLNREFIDPSIVPGMTMLDYWVLDESVFPEVTLWKIRIPVSGKGYSPRLYLRSVNEEPFELLNHIWVFRQMNSR